jgi:N4-gp56 family major capsid protein
MANPGSYTGGPTELAGSTNLVQTAYDRMAYFSLRPELYFDQVADVRATNQAMPGNVVKFTIVNDLAISPVALQENADVTPVAFSDSQVTVTLAEYGNAMVTSAKLRGTAFVDVDPVVANLIGYNAGVTLDTVARSVLDAGTQVAYTSGSGATSRATVQQGSSFYLGSTDIRQARARLRSQNVPTFGGSYVGFIHPDTVVDIQSNDTTLAGWRAPHVYSAPSEIWTGDLGMYEGIRWIETPRAPYFEGAGSSSGLSAGTYTITSAVSGGAVTGTFTGTAPAVGATLTTKSGGCSVSGTVTITDLSSSTFTASGTGTVTLAGDNSITASAYGANVYGTLILGRQSLAKAHALADGNGPLPSIVPGPVTDLLRRYVPLGWYWLGGYAIFRQASVYRIEHASSLGADLQTSYAPPIDEGETGSTPASMA